MKSQFSFTNLLTPSPLTANHQTDRDLSDWYRKWSFRPISAQAKPKTLILLLHGFQRDSSPLPQAYILSHLRSFSDCCIQPDGATLRDNHAMRAGTFRRSENRAQIMRICDAIQKDDKGSSPFALAAARMSSTST